jgi:hypothetical protein
VFLSACETGHSPLGLAVTQENDLRLLFNPCGRDYQSVREVIVFDDTDNVIWRIRAVRSDAGVRQYTIGSVPDGFVEVEPLKTTPLGSVRFVVRDDDDERADETVDIERLRRDEIYVPREGFLSESEYSELNTCPADGLF